MERFWVAGENCAGAAFRDGSASTLHMCSKVQAVQSWVVRVRYPASAEARRMEVQESRRKREMFMIAVWGPAAPLRVA